MSAIAIGILGMGYLMGLAVYTISFFWRTGRILDHVLALRGLASENYLVFGRQYRGKSEGREMVVRFVPWQGIRP